MALIKGKKGDVKNAAPAQKRSALIKSWPVDAPAEPEWQDEVSEEEFEEEPSGEFQEVEATVPALAAVTGRLLGHRVAGPPPVAESKLPPIGGASVQVPTGEAPPRPKVEAGAPAAAPVPQAPPPPPPPPIDQQIVEEARRKAQQIVGEAQEEAKRLIDEIRLHASMAHKEAMEKGIEEGREEGRRLGREEYQKLFDTARDMYQQAIRERERLLASAETELARLSIKVAERIIGQEVRSAGEVIMGVVRQALSGIKDREEVLIRVSPDDYHIVNADRTSLARLVEGMKNFELVVDGKVEAGGCIIETNLGNIDARLSTQLSAIAAAFERVVQGEEEDPADDAG